MKKFDLNIEKVLEDWEPHHAIRELIANAMDETVLSRAKKDIAIFKDEAGAWHIRDFGRGLTYQHLTQKENDEKLNSPQLIGKFGVGLKDALATFDRRGIGIVIKSAHGDITLQRTQKHGFSDIVTLHAVVKEPSEPTMKGTQCLLYGCPDNEVELAKRMFLKFSGDTLLESTSYGDVLSKQTDSGFIYINGVRVAEEENFLFSYNITALNAAIKRALNRERTNVGRTAYADRVKSILLSCRSAQVAESMVGDLMNFQKGVMKDELKWTDVYVHACKLLNAQQKAIFVTPNERGYAGAVLVHARDDGYRVITIPENVKAKLAGEVDYEGNPIFDLNEYVREWNESFEFNFVPPSRLTTRERAIYDRTEEIFELIGGRPEDVQTVKISETMRMNKPGRAEIVGVWESDLGRIVIKRTQLQSLSDYAGTLLHEAAHAATNAPDISEYFEMALTEYLGLVAEYGLPAESRQRSSRKMGKGKTKRSA